MKAAKHKAFLIQLLSHFHGLRGCAELDTLSATGLEKRVYWELEKTRCTIRQQREAYDSVVAEGRCDMARIKALGTLCHDLLGKLPDLADRVAVVEQIHKLMQDDPTSGGN